MAKPLLFIGSARESSAVVDALETQLLDCVEVERWDYDTFKPGRYLMQDLSEQLARSDFAAFILGQDDRTVSRGKSQPSPRDNVIFEAGLFTSGLGVTRTFYVVDSRGTKRPSDWDGIGYLSYFAERRAPRQRVLEAAQAIRARVEEIGPRTTKDLIKLIHGDWWQFVINADAEAVLSHMTIDAADPHSIAVRGRSWSRDGKQHSTYRNRTASFDASSGTLFYSWAGEHPTAENMPNYFGVGQIQFQWLAEKSRSGQGFYSTTNSARPKATLVNQCLYFAISQKEIAILRKGQHKDVAALAAKKLGERAKLRK